MATELVEVKKWYLSKTMIVNLIMGLLATAAVFTDILGVVELPNEATIAFGIQTFVNIVNIILRALTKSPLTV